MVFQFPTQQQVLTPCVLTHFLETFGPPNVHEIPDPRTVAVTNGSKAFLFFDKWFLTTQGLKGQVSPAAPAFTLLSVSDTLPRGGGVKGWVGGSKAFFSGF